jgi:hypothetical protein
MRTIPLGEGPPIARVSGAQHTGSLEFNNDAERMVGHDGTLWFLAFFLLS